MNLVWLSIMTLVLVCTTQTLLIQDRNSISNMRIVVTFYKQHAENATYDVVNATVVKMYGRRLVLSLWTQVNDSNIMDDIWNRLGYDIDTKLVETIEID